MKKYLISMVMLMALTVAPTVTAQNQHKDGQELKDSTHQDEALEAYSDTTAMPDTTVVSQSHRIGGYINGSSVVSNVFDKIGLEGLAGMAFVLMVLVIIFILAPLVFFLLLFIFVYKNRKQKLKLAEMAMKQGQPIPDQLLTDQKDSDEDTWKTGIRQTFLGVGLLAFFGYLGSTLGIGVGILVTAIGLGKLAIVKTSNRQ